MVFPQLVNAASVNGSTKKFIHLVLRVHGLLNTTAVNTAEAADQTGNTGKSSFLCANVRDQYSRVFTGGLIDPLKKKTTTDRSDIKSHSLGRNLWPGSVSVSESHHLSEDFGVFGPGEGPVRDPAWHQPLVGVGSRPLHLGHHRLLLLLLRGKNMKAT